MNVHFFLTFADDASNSPFAKELKHQNINFILLSELISLRYKHRVWLYFIGWPRWVLFSFRQSWRSLFAKPRADWVVVQSHFDILAMATLVLLLLKPKPRIMLMGFIYTKKSSIFLAKLKFIYFSAILRFVDCVICHSKLEVENNITLFKLPNTRFVYIPYGLHLESPVNALQNKNYPAYAVSAGRSGRDYELLIRVFSENGYPLHIICDSAGIADNKELASNIKILNGCYGDDYINELAAAKVVVIPISVDDISAGQMVLLQAMALKKPIVITDTPTTRLYGRDNHTALFVKKGESVEMHKAINKLWTNKELCNTLSENAYTHFLNNHSMAAFVSNICKVLREFS